MPSCRRWVSDRARQLGDRATMVMEDCKMKLPKQLPAVDRNSSKTAVVAVGANVRPSDIPWGQIASTAVPILASLF